MESAGILKICERAPSKGYNVGVIISDDDTNMRAHLKHRKSLLKSDKGKLASHIPEPKFLADPTHRVKTFASHIFKLANIPMKKSPVRKSHAKQMKHYWGCFLKQNRYKTLEEIRFASKAPLAHLCNDHSYCRSN